MSTQRRTLFIGGGIVIALAAFAVWWFTRPAPAEVDITAAIDSAASDGAATESAAPASPSTPGATDADATDTDAPDAAAGQVWTVDTEVVAYDFEAPAGTFAGFRIDEELSSVGATTAVARTPAVTGSLTLDGTHITDATFTADLTGLESDRSQRNGAIQRALGTSEHPDGTFTLTEPIELDGMAPVGEAIEAQGTGTLTVNGVTNDVTIPLQAALVAEDQLVVTSSFEVSLADYDVTAPSARVVVSVADIATVEVQLYFVP